MSIALGIIAGIYFIAFLTVLASYLTAPEGHEDETGFYLVWVNDKPGFKNVACVWP